MNTHKLKFRRLLILSAWVLPPTTLIGAVALRPATPANPAPTSQQASKGRVPVTSRANLPAVISKVKRVEVVSAVVKEDGPNPVVQLEVRNSSDVAVRELTISNGILAEVEYSTTYGMGDPDHPITVIEPKGARVFDIALANLDGKYPILISGATFADSTEDGDREMLEHMRFSREEHRKELRDRRQKGGVQ